MNPELPRRTPGASHIPHYRTAAPSMSLLIRVAQGLDEWAERDRNTKTQPATKHAAGE
ncbi:hypothetical protein ABIA39_009137 [Nocardia sp. GAS34]|uniref:hypothetical protein n=1 Tax=unclassified Nocardia TaxID=2637762 RepID=UPI003D1D49BE